MTRPARGDGHRHHHGHQHRDLPGEAQAHGLGFLAPLPQHGSGFHQLDRRRFLADLGRGTSAVAILMSGLAACGGSSGSPASSPTATSERPPTPGAAALTTADADPAATGSPEAPTEGASEVAQALQWAQVSFRNVSAYVLVRGNEAAVVDTGNPGGADEIAATLTTLGAGWNDVRHVVLTHSHNDHVGGLGDVLARATNATAYGGEADIGAISSPTPLRAVGDGDDIFGLEVINTPGHTPGSISVLDREIGLLIAGDALNGNQAGTEIVGPNASFTADMAEAIASVGKLGGFSYDIAAFGHGNPYRGEASAAVVDLAGSL